MTSDEFRDRVAVVTGASSGIGRATAELLEVRGARVVVFARSAGKLEALANERVLAVAGDAASEEDVARLFAATEQRFGPCELLVNNAGMIDVRHLVETTSEAWDRMFAVNVRSAFLTTRRALPSMLAAKRGSIVNVASISGVIGPQKFPGFVSYCASKAAMISMTEALAGEVAAGGVRVNCVSPGAVDTAMWAEASGGAPASMTPAEVAESIAFLLSDRSRPMNGMNLPLWSAA